MVSVALALVAGTGLAQSIITLDDFDLSEPEGVAPAEDAPSAASRSEMEACLTGGPGCTSRELKSGAEFSLEDVVNLGIIDREATPRPAATGVAGSEVGESRAADMAEPLPSIDMEIVFDYNSDSIRADQLGRLVELSGILGTSRFESYDFAFIGHSDAAGLADYNRDLSRRRAEAVAEAVQSMTRLPPERFTATGLGFDRLKTPGDPLGPQNRRVQLVLIPR